MESFLFNPPDGMHSLEFYLEQIGLTYFQDRWVTPKELKRDRDPLFVSHFHAATHILKAKIEEKKFGEKGLLVSHFKQSLISTHKILKFWTHITHDFCLFGQYANGEEEGTVFLRLNLGGSLFNKEELSTTQDMFSLKNGGNPHIIRLLEYLYNEKVIHACQNTSIKELANQIEDDLGRGTYPRRFIEDLVSQIRM